MGAEPAISFTELLAYIEAEERRWEEWFHRNPEALDVAVDIAEAQTVRDLVCHIFGVASRTAERLLGHPMTVDGRIDSTSIESMFGMGIGARSKLRQFLGQISEEQLARPRQFQSATLGSFIASPRKLMTHAVVHGVRHWAQIATVLRQNGYPQDWPHDVIFTDAMV
jgi:uncharacterized damage-inducible protein DinB